MGIKDMARLRGLMQDGDVQGLVDVLCCESKSGPERRYAAAALGDLRARQAVEPLVEMLDDAKVCEAAIQALVNIGDPIAAAPLAELFSSADDRVLRRQAEMAIRKLYDRHPREVRVVLERYERFRNGGGSPETGL